MPVEFYREKSWNENDENEINKSKDKNASKQKENAIKQKEMTRK